MPRVANSNREGTLGEVRPGVFASGGGPVKNGQHATTGRRRGAILVALSPTEEATVAKAAALSGQRLAPWARDALLRAATRTVRRAERQTEAARVAEHRARLFRSGAPVRKSLPIGVAAS